MKKIGGILLPFAVYFVVHDLASLLLAFLVGMGRNVFGEGYWEFVEAHSASVHGILNGLSLCLGMAAVLPLAKGELRWRSTQLDKEPQPDRNPVGKGLDEKKGPDGKKDAAFIVMKYLLLIAWAVSLAVGMNLLLTLAGVTEQSENYAEISAKQYGVAFGLGLLLYGVVSPVAEEIVFRGVIYNRIRKCFRAAPSVLLCGILFGVYHGNLVQGIYGCVLGTVITLVYEWDGSLLAPVLFHGAANAGVFAVSYDAEVFRGIVTPCSCAVWLIVSVFAGVFSKKMSFKHASGKMRCGYEVENG